MCYSNTCTYENHMGNCTVPCTRDFEEVMGVSPCEVGGFAGIPEEHQLSNEKQIELQNKAKEMKLLW